MNISNDDILNFLEKKFSLAPSVMELNISYKPGLN